MEEKKPAEGNNAEDLKMQDEKIKEKSQVELNGLLMSLVPIATDYFKHKLDIEQEQLLQNHKALDAETKIIEWKLKYARYQFNWYMFLAVGILVIVFGISFGLIFVMEKVTEGLAVLGYLITMMLGIVGGIGWQKSQDKSKEG